jgi:hypothetical protein
MGHCAIYCPVCGLDLNVLSICDGLITPPGSEWQYELNFVGKWNNLPSNFRTALQLPPLTKPNRNDFPGCWLFWWDIIEVGVQSGRADTLPAMHFTEGGNQIMFPLHRSCLEVVRLVVKRYSQQHDMRLFIQCLIYQRRKNLNEIKELRLPEGVIMGEGSDLDIPPSCIEWDHKYYGLERYCNSNWSATGPKWMWYNPIEASNLTEYVISQLRPAINAEPTQQEIIIFRENISLAEKLPVELLDRIIFFLPGYTVLSLQSTSKMLRQKIRLDQRFWRDELISGCVGILFDLDEKLLLEKDSKRPLRGEPDAEWDWKGLVAKFSRLQSDFLNEKLSWETTPRALRNRCRVWKIARDIQEYATGLEAEDKLKDIEPSGFVEGVPALIPDLRLRDYSCPRQINFC